MSCHPWLAMRLLLSGCYLAHGTAEPSPIEIGSGFGTFEPIPLEGGVLRIEPHPRGQHGVVLSIRVVGIDPAEAAVTCSVIDPSTDRVIAEPRLDELHRWTRWTREGDRWVSSGTFALFDWDLEPAELDGEFVRVSAVAPPRR